MVSVLCGQDMDWKRMALSDGVPEDSGVVSALYRTACGISWNKDVGMGINRKYSCLWML